MILWLVRKAKGFLQIFREEQASPWWDAKWLWSWKAIWQSTSFHFPRPWNDPGPHGLWLAVYYFCGGLKRQGLYGMGLGIGPVATFCNFLFWRLCPKSELDCTARLCKTFLCPGSAAEMTDPSKKLDWLSLWLVRFTGVYPLNPFEVFQRIWEVLHKMRWVWPFSSSSSCRIFSEIRMLQQLGPGLLEENSAEVTNMEEAEEAYAVGCKSSWNPFQGDALVHLQVDPEKLWYKVLAANLETEFLEPQPFWDSFILKWWNVYAQRWCWFGVCVGERCGNFDDPATYNLMPFYAFFRKWLGASSGQVAGAKEVSRRRVLQPNFGIQCIHLPGERCHCGSLWRGKDAHDLCVSGACWPSWISFEALGKSVFIKCSPPLALMALLRKHGSSSGLVRGFLRFFSQNDSNIFALFCLRTQVGFVEILTWVSFGYLWICRGDTGSPIGWIIWYFVSEFCILGNNICKFSEVTLSIENCCDGPPLLPQANKAADAKPYTPEDWQLSESQQHFCIFLWLLALPLSILFRIFKGS